MEFSDIRPIFSGLIGGAIAVGLTAFWAKWVPTKTNGKSAASLLERYRRTIRIANILLAAGLVAGTASYQFGGFANNDWRPLALCIGGGASAALLALAVIPWLTGGTPREAYAAYAISQKSPMLVLYPLLACGVVLFGIAVYAFLR